MKSALFLASFTLLVAAAGAQTNLPPAGQEDPCLGYRALVIRPDAPLRSYDTVVQSELLRLGMDVTCADADLLARPEALAAFDLVAGNTVRRYTPEQVAGLKAYLVQGGAFYGSWGGPMECPELLALCGVRRAQSVTSRGFTVLDGPFAGDLGTWCVAFPLWVTDGFWGDANGGKTIVTFEPADGTSVAKDTEGRCAGVFHACGKGRTALLGFGPENYKFITEDHVVARKLLRNLLTWLLPPAPGPHPFSGTIEVRLPRDARVGTVAVNGVAVTQPVQRVVGSLRSVLLPASLVGDGATATVQVTYVPPAKPRHIDTWLIGAYNPLTFSNAAEAADFAARLGATTAWPFVRWCGGCDFFRPALPLPGENVEVRNTPENYLKDYIDACHAHGLRVVPGLKIDWERYPKINATAPSLVNDKGVADAKKVCPLDPSVQKHNVDLVACLLDQYPTIDAMTLDDNFEFQVHPCCCDACEAKLHAYCAKNGLDEKAATARDAFWRAEVRAFVAQVRAACAARGKPLGAWRELAMDELSTQVLDFHGAMGYEFPAATARLGLLAMPEDKGYVKALWGMNRRPEEIEREAVEAIRAGCAAIGFWITPGRHGPESDGNWGYGTKEARLDRPSLTPGTLDAVRRAFAMAEQNWAVYYRDNLLGGDVRFALLSAEMRPGALTLTVKNLGRRAEKRILGTVDLKGLPE